MRYKKTLHLLWMTGMLLVAAAGKSTAQLVLWNPNYSIGTATGKYSFAWNQTPDQLVNIYSAYIFLPGGAGYQWEQSTVPAVSGFGPISGATSSTYNFSQALTQDMWYRLKTYSLSNPSNYVYSNIIKLSYVSVNWEDQNYYRVHEVLTTNITDWRTVDTMSIGPKTQTTKYIDGLGRVEQMVSRETATPATAGSTWGDIVQPFQYDALGMQPVKYLHYTTTAQTGKFKTTALTDEASYYTATANETAAFSTVRFDNSPLNRVVDIRNPGASWAASSGDSTVYEVNTAADSVQLFNNDYVQGDAPVDKGPYSPGTLYKVTYLDENQHKTMEYIDMLGRMVLRKVQVDASPSTGHAGWICTYYVYDDFGHIVFQIQPEGVKWLNSNSWSFAGTDGPTVLAEQVFQYFYDDKARTIWKKVPGAAAQNLIYDTRDRLVFMQDGNQAAKSPHEWTATLFDELDRPTISTLYETNETIAQLQGDIAAATTTSSVNTVSSAPNPVTNLSVYSRNTSIAVYSASQSITFYPDSSFSTPNGDQFVARIDPLVETGQSSTVAVTTIGSPISAANLANSSVTTILKYFYYDDYSFATAKTFDNNFTNTSAYGTSDPNVMPIVQDQRTTDLPTGSLTRILGTNTFLAMTEYYDIKGRAIQNLEDNIKGGVDILTLQHHFDGRLLSKCLSHTAPGTGFSAYITLDKYIFDKLGRVVSIQDQYGSNAVKTVASFDYDDVGRVKTKHLDPNYNNPNSGQPDLESLNYTFNIHNQLTGINKDYALKTAGSYSKWGHFFGLYLGYDNKDGAFSGAQLNGLVTGQMWSTQGDDAQRKYDYSYDNAGRLTNAVFNQQQHPTDGWSNSSMDFSVSGFGGQITYDYNSNLQALQQKGVIPGTSAPIVIDDLRYAYSPHSNKLLSVTDQMTTPTVNGQSGDFSDGATGTGTSDYVYDNNGNVVIDLNKNVQSLNGGAAGTNGITYNYLDKPEQIRIVGKGTIKIVYSADGDKLQRVYIPESGGLSTVTTYISSFVYQQRGALTLAAVPPFSVSASDTLNYIQFEEGRIRAMTPVPFSNGLDGLSENGNITLPGGQVGSWDYFIRDYQMNTRMVLTEETHVVQNTCTMETGRSSAEDPVFGQTGAGNEVETTRYPTPAGWASVNTSTSVSQLGKNAGHYIGPNVLQKVMAGDQVTASVQYFFQGTITNSNPNIIPNVVNSLAAAIGGGSTAGTLVHGNAGAISGQLNGSQGFITAVEPSGGAGSTPQAYLTMLFFDERFNLVAAADGGVVQQQVTSPWTSSNQTLGMSRVLAPKNGYVYIYVSNRSDQDVYFDNMVVGISAGNIIEENHYYAYGLKIAGLSSRKLGDGGEGVLANKYQFNGKELFDDADLNWYDYGYRNYDPQIGRFTQLDPMADDYPMLTPFQFAGCDPIANVDLDGLEPSNVVSFMKGLGDAVGPSAQLLNAGKHAGDWVVTWMKDGVIYAKIFKTVVPTVNTTLKVSSMAVKAANFLTRFDGWRIIPPQSDNLPKNVYMFGSKGNGGAGTSSTQKSGDNSPSDNNTNKNIPKYLQIAINEIGQSEISGPKDNSRISDDYFGAAGHKGWSDDENPWCGAFVTWVFKQVGVQQPMIKGKKESFPGGAGAMNWLKIWDGGEEVTNPTLGDLVVIDYGGGKGHVGFVVGRRGDQIAILGGNQSIKKGGDGVTVNAKWNTIKPSMKFVHPKNAPYIPLTSTPVCPMAGTKAEEITLKTSR